MWDLPVQFLCWWYLPGKHPADVAYAEKPNYEQTN